ncbi:MAG: PspA/IM30 family protein [Cytophagales bacterium]|nr:PspA/IM30 family protein [Bernardetiaceae bacterium]MDW8209986.1 PspA/IM30 family protein [Cytophagales bacterium]
MKRLLARICNAFFRKQKEQAEDPALLVEQHIDQLKSYLSDNLKSLAELKAMYIRHQQEIQAQKHLAQDYERRAIVALEKARDGHISQLEADQLAMQALAKKQAVLQQVQSAESALQHYQQTFKQLEEQTMQLKTQIDQWQGELKTLKAKQQISQTTISLHQPLFKPDSHQSLALLESLKEKVAHQQALAEAYRQIAQGKTTVEDRVDRILSEKQDSNVNAGT